MPLVEEELHTFPEHLGSPQVFGEVRATRSLVLDIFVADRCLSFCILPKYNRNFIKSEPNSIPHIVSHQRDEEQNNLVSFLAICVSKLYSQWYNFIYFPSMFHDLAN
jgi:hypothetical protein